MFLVFFSFNAPAAVWQTLIFRAGFKLHTALRRIEYKRVETPQAVTLLKTFSGNVRYGLTLTMNFFSIVKTFVLTVVTNENDLDDVANRGFSLNYQQLPCGGVTSGMFLQP